MSIESLRVMLRPDAEVQTFIRIANQVRSTINSERLLKEAEGLQLARKSRTLYRIACQPTPLYDALTDDIRCRARFTEIRLSAYKQRSIMENALSRVKAHILERYSQDLLDLASSMTERRAMIDRLFRVSSEHIENLRIIENTMALYVEDIDKAGYGLTNSVRILENLLGHKHAASV